MSEGFLNDKGILPTTSKDRAQNGYTTLAEAIANDNFQEQNTNGNNEKTKPQVRVSIDENGNITYSNLSAPNY